MTANVPAIILGIKNLPPRPCHGIGRALFAHHIESGHAVCSKWRSNGIYPSSSGLNATGPYHAVGSVIYVLDKYAYKGKLYKRSQTTL